VEETELSSLPKDRSNERGNRYRDMCAKEKEFRKLPRSVITRERSAVVYALLTQAFRREDYNEVKGGAHREGI